MKYENDIIDLDLWELDLRKIQTCTLPMMMNKGEIWSKEDERRDYTKYGATNMISTQW